MENYEVQRLSANNIEHLIPLHKATNHQLLSEDFLRKKYNTKSFGAEFIGYIAYSRAHLPIAFYGVIPCLVQLDGKSILAAQSADTMTHPDFQRQGLFYSLAIKTFELAKQHGIQFIFGFASTNSLPGTIKLDFRILPTPMQLFKVRTGIPPLGRWLSRFPASKSLYNAYVERVLSANGFPPINLFRDKTLNGIKHDQLFIDYKGYSKKFFFQMNGFLLWLKVDGLLKVGFVSLGHDNPLEFIRGIRRLTRILGCSHAIFITNKQSAIYELLAKAITPADVLPVCFKNLTSKPFAFENMEFEYGDIDIF